jgi:hypothetical protein
MKKEQIPQKLVLFLYRFQCIGIKNGEESAFTLEFYDDNHVEATAHAERTLRLHNVKRVGKWHIDHLDYINFN